VTPIAFKQVVQLVKENSGWGKEAFLKAKEWGVAAHRRLFTYVACVVEVEVD